MAQHTHNTAYMTQLINLEDILIDTNYSHRYDFYTGYRLESKIKDYKNFLNSRLFYAYGISMEPWLYSMNRSYGELFRQYFATNIDDLLNVYDVWKDKDIYLGYRRHKLHGSDESAYIKSKQWWIAYDRMLHDHFYHLMGYNYIYKDYDELKLILSPLGHNYYDNTNYWNTKPYYVDTNNAKFEPRLSPEEEKEVYEIMEEAISRDSYLPNVMIGCHNLVDYFPLLTKPLPIKHIYKEQDNDTAKEYNISVNALYNTEYSVREKTNNDNIEIKYLKLYDVVYTDKSRRNILIMNYIPNEIENMEYYTFAHNEKPRILLNHGNRHLIYETTIKKLFSNDSLFPDFVAIIRDYKKDTLINKSEDKYSLNASSLFDDATYRKILKRIDDICADYWKNPKEIYRRCRDVVDEVYSRVVKVYRLNKKTIKEYIKTNLLKKNIWENEDTPITLEIAFVKYNDYESKDNADKNAYVGALNIFITTPNINHYLIFSAKIKDTNTGELSCTPCTPDNNTFLKVIDKRRSYVYITGTDPNYVIKYSNKIPDGFKALKDEIRYQNCIVCVPDIPIGKDSPVHPDSTNKNNPLWYWYDMDNDGIINGKDIPKSYEYIYLPIKEKKGETRLEDAILCTAKEIPDNYIESTHTLRELEVPPIVKAKYNTWPNTNNKIVYPLKVLLPKYMDGQSHLYDDPDYPWIKWLNESILHSMEDVFRGFNPTIGSVSTIDKHITLGNLGSISKYISDELVAKNEYISIHILDGSKYINNINHIGKLKPDDSYDMPLEHELEAKTYSIQFIYHKGKHELKSSLLEFDVTQFVPEYKPLPDPDPTPKPEPEPEPAPEPVPTPTECTVTFNYGILSNTIPNKVVKVPYKSHYHDIPGLTDIENVLSKYNIKNVVFIGFTPSIDIIDKDITFTAVWETYPVLELKGMEMKKGDDFDFKKMIVKATSYDGKRDITDQVQVTDTGGFDKDKPGHYEITFTLTYDKTVITKRATLKVMGKLILEVRNYYTTSRFEMYDIRRDMIVEAKFPDGTDARDKVGIHDAYHPNLPEEHSVTFILSYGGEKIYKTAYLHLSRR